MRVVVTGATGNIGTSLSRPSGRDVGVVLEIWTDLVAPAAL